MPGRSRKPRVSRRRITSNMEDYLEAIFELSGEGEGREVRVTDIAHRLRVTRPSVVGMIKHLAERDLVQHDHYGKVRLSPEGRKVAVETLNRHRVLRRFLEEVLGLDAELAEEDACRMEHALSPETIERFIALEEFRERSPKTGDLKGESFRKFLRDRKLKKKATSPPAGKTRGASP